MKFARMFVIVLGVLWVLPSMGHAAPIDDALKLRKKGRLEEAVEVLQKAVQEDPQNAHLQYNLGTFLYEAGRYDQASEALVRSMTSTDQRLRQKAAYNLGNTYAQMGQVKQAQGPQQAMKDYEQALTSYRMAIEADKKDKEAKINYELVNKQLKLLKEQMPPESQQGQEGESDENGDEHSQESQESQESQGQQGEQEQQQGESAQEGQPESESESSSSESDGTEDAQQSQSGQPQKDAEELSQQEAEWVLDSLRREESLMPMQTKQRGREYQVERDW